MLSALPPLLAMGPLLVGPALGSLCLAQCVRTFLGPLLPGDIHSVLILAAACVADTPLHFLCWGAAVHGGTGQHAAAYLCVSALAFDVHFRRPLCEALTAAFTIALSPAGYANLSPKIVLASHAVLLVQAIAGPAFPAGQAVPAHQTASAAPPQGAPAPGAPQAGPPAAQGLAAAPQPGGGRVPP